VIEVSKGDRTYSNIASIMRPPKGMTAPVEPVEPLQHWDMSAPDWQVFAALPSRLQDQIAASPEFQKLNPPRSVNLAPTAPATTTAPAAPASSGFDDVADDIPF